MLTALRIRIGENIKNFNIEVENIKNIYETYICNFYFIYITEMKNTLRVFTTEWMKQKKKSVS